MFMRVLYTKIKLCQPPANTVGEPEVIDPASAESPTRAIGLLLTYTVPDPTFIAAV
jgi:hypothetical protein